MQFYNSADLDAKTRARLKKIIHAPKLTKADLLWLRETMFPALSAEDKRSLLNIVMKAYDSSEVAPGMELRGPGRIAIPEFTPRIHQGFPRLREGAMVRETQAKCRQPAYHGFIEIWVDGVPWNHASHGQTGCMSQYKDDKNNVLGIFAAARDVTESKQALFYARSVIEAGLDPMITISPEGKITDVKTVIGLFWLEKLQRGEWK